MASKKKHGSHGHGEHVILPKRTYLAVFGVLLVLTVLTVIVASIDLGGLNVGVAIGIAVVKALLVVLYFMMLKFDNRVNAMVFSVGVAFLLIFLAFTMLDTELRGRFERIERTTIMDHRRLEQEAQLADPGVVDIMIEERDGEMQVVPPPVDEEEVDAEPQAEETPDDAPPGAQ